MSNIPFQSPDENIILDTRPSLKRMLVSSRAFMSMLLIFFGTIAFSFFFSFPVQFIVIAFLLTVLSSLGKIFIYRTTRYILSDRRVVIESGFFGKDYRIISLDKVVDYTVDVTPLDNIMGTGNIILFTANDKGFPVNYLSNPRTLVELLNL